MTVCIAAMAHEYIVSASDTMITGSTLSTDACCSKWEPFAEEWQAMITGDDIAPASPIIEKAGQYLKGRPNTLEEVRRSFKRAFQNQLSEMAADRVLGRFGVSMREFKKSGKKIFDETTLARLCGEIQNVHFAGLEFLVWGFDSDRTPHIFTVRGDGEDAIFDRPGFASVGSGGYAADTLLYYFNQSRQCDLYETVFHVCAGKFMAERAGAGLNTSLFVRKHGTSVFSHHFSLIDNLRAAWEEHGSPRVPLQALEAIQRANVRCQTLDEHLADFTVKQPDPQSPKPDPSDPQPSPESPGGSDES
ncbi:MAG TPA: hypothetical protein VGE89_04905 [Bryobacteraceae bacterium]|jgi:hypothetical protein